MGVEVREITNYDLWNNFIESSWQGTIFCRTDWTSLYDGEIKIYGVFKGESLLGGIIGFEKGDEFRSGYNIPITPFQGVCCLLQSQNTKYTALMSVQLIVGQALADYLAIKYAKVGISNYYTFPDIRPFKWSGYKEGIKYTYIHPNLQFLWDNIEKDTRWEIHQNEKKKIEKTEDIDRFDELYGLTFKRKGMERHASSTFVKNVFKKFKPLVYMTENSGVMFIQDTKRWYYIFGASDGSGESSFCLYYALKDLNKGVDFCGANDRNIGNFKKNFGGILTPYFQVSKNL